MPWEFQQAKRVWLAQDAVLFNACHCRLPGSLPFRSANHKIHRQGRDSYIPIGAESVLEEQRQLGTCPFLGVPVLAVLLFQSNSFSTLHVWELC